jgi:hypothetical protein
MKLLTRVGQHLAAFFLILSLTGLASAAPRLRADHPDVYTVVRGDTLWDISGRFLKNPWEWPRVWKNNPQIKNPHLIYPGDRIRLVYVNGRPELRLQRGAHRPGDHYVPAIPSKAVQGFLRYHKVITSEGEIDHLPHVLANEEDRKMVSPGDRVYVRAHGKNLAGRYGLFRPVTEIEDPDTGEWLGVVMRYVGGVEMLDQPRNPDVRVARVYSARQEILEGDILYPEKGGSYPLSFHPAPAPDGLRGRVVYIDDGIDFAGPLSIIGISKGRRDGIRPGHMVTLNLPERIKRDRHWSGARDMVLPEVQSDLAMVFQSMEKMSFALVMKGWRPLEMGYLVRTPK